jgi:hypothetical protein
MEDIYNGTQNSDDAQFLRHDLRTVPRLALQLEILGYKDFTRKFRTQKKKEGNKTGT